MVMSIKKGTRSLTDAIKHATGSVGKVPDHQRRVGRKILGAMNQDLGADFPI
jgi:hypothetical protein